MAVKGLRKITGIIASALLITALTGCGSSEAETYVSALLDVAYGRDVDAYAKIADIDKEVAEGFMEQSLQAEAVFMAKYYGFDEKDTDVTEVFVEFCKKLYDKAKYTVNSKDGNKVSVEIEPLMVLEQAEEDIEAYLEEYNVKAYVDGDKSATRKSAAEKIVQICETYIDKAKYGNPVTVEIDVEEKEGTWLVSDERLNEVDENIISYGRTATN